MTSRSRISLLALLAAGCATSAGYAISRTRAPAPAAVPGTSARPSAVGVASVSVEPRAYAHRVKLPERATRPAAPGFAKARGWLNVTRPPTSADFAGRVVVVDFWTSCCINCMHTIPVLARLEEKHAKDPVVFVGVHTQKFDAEPEIERLRASVIRLGVKHPVAIDGDKGVWESWGVDAWPTIFVLDAHGRVVFDEGGEPREDELDDVIESALADGADEHALATTPASFLGREIDAAKPLAFPEKIAAIPGGFAIADSGHDRLVLVDERGRAVDVVGDGTRGFVDGDFAHARFAHPQGVAAIGDRLYVADTENHAIRVVDRKRKVVSTIAGTGALGHAPLKAAPAVDARSVALRSPWDVVAIGDVLYVALAGSHQIATLDPARGTLQLFAGVGLESRADGPRLAAAFAQPSGLATDGKDLFVLDSETSSLRAITLATGEVKTLVGEALFVFGDRDGRAADVRLQHPIGLTFGGGALWVADTYNSKIKRVDPRTGETTTVVGGPDHAAFLEPAGLAWAPATTPTLLVADTDHARIVRVDVGARRAAPWPLQGLAAP